MGRRYHGITKTISGTEWTYELWNGLPADAPDTSIRLIIASAEMDIQGERDLLYENPLKPSSVTVGFTATPKADMRGDTNAQQNLINIGLDEESKWALKILKNGSFYWVGRVLADQITYSRSHEHGWVIEIKAVDALNLIEGFFVDPTWFTLESNTRQTAIVLMSEIFTLTGLTDYFGSNVFGDGILTTNASFPAARTLAYTTFNETSFIDNFTTELKSDEIKWMNCRDALENMLQTFAPIRMTLDNGVYMVTQPNAYESATISIDYYDKSGAYNSTSNLTHAVAIGTTQRPQWVAKPQQSWQRPLREIEIQWRKQNMYLTERTTAASTVLTATDTALATGGTLPGRVVKVTFSCEFYYTGAQQHKFRLQTHVSAKSGSTYYYWNGSAWTSNGANPLYGYTDFFQLEYTSGLQQYSVSFEVPEPPSGYNLECGMALQRISGTIIYNRTGSYVSWSTTTTNYENFTGLIAISQAYTNTDPREYFLDRKYEIDIDPPADSNSQRLEFKNKYHDAAGRDEIGGVRVWNGTTYANPGNWSVSWHSDTGEINAVLGGSIAGLYSQFLPTIYGDWIDAASFTFMKSLSFDSATWIMNGGKFNFKDEIWSGEWVQVDVDYTLYTPNGEGQRTQQTSGDTLETKVKVLEEQMAKMHAVIGNFANGYLPSEIINFSTNGPTTDPGADSRYMVQLSYNYSAQTLGFDVAETGEAQWISIVKNSDESIISDDSLADDSQLVFPVLENSTYSFRGHVAFETDSAADFKFEFGGVAAAASVEISGIDGNGNHFISNAFNDAKTIYVSATGTYHVTFNGVITTGATAGDISFRWSQYTSEATSTTVKKGSYIEYMKMPVSTVVEYLLMETGDFLLLETGDKIILD